jgi:Cytochrome c7 and related cytochrome c/Class III cytochrome C family
MRVTRRALSLVAFALLLVFAAAWAQSSSAPAAGAQAPPPPAPAQPAPAAEATAPQQPIAFSHKKHAGELQMRCNFCHAQSRSGETLAIPQATTCMTCHATVATSNPEIQKLTAFAKSNETIPWVRVYQLPSFVTFSHKMHLDHGNTCEECHGPVPQRDQIFQETDISMGGCLSCHRRKQATTECNACHTLQQ